MSTGTGTGTPVSTGAITATATHTRVLERLHSRASLVADIDPELQSVLHDISTRDDFLWETGSIVTVAGTASYNAPTDHKRVLEISRSGGNLLNEMTFREYQMSIMDESSPPQSEPEYWTYWNGKLYLYQIPDAVYTFSVYGSVYHSDAIATIEFDVKFREAIINGVLAFLWGGKLGHLPEAPQKFAQHSLVYEKEIDNQKDILERQPRFVRYTDI